MIRWISAVLLVATSCAPGPRDIWNKQQADLLRNGKLRLDRQPRDAPFTNADIARTFRHVMFLDENVLRDGRYVAAWQPRPLKKRNGPVTYTLSGKGVTEADRRHLEEVVLRLGEATGLMITPVPASAAIHVFIAGPGQRQTFADILEERRAGHPLVQLLREDLGGNTCIAVPFRRKDGTGDAPYMIFIPEEVEGRLRRGCIEEEFAQAFGPAADFPGARPSIFNDDQEFAVLTELDIWMFRVLYDPRLQAGMLERQAMPIVRRILAEIRPE